MRTCDRCGIRMQPFIARARLDDGSLGCEDCRGMVRSASFKKTAALTNPRAEKSGRNPKEWYHGSIHAFEDLDTEPDRYHSYDDEFENNRFSHWNTLIGPHFASDHGVARDFSEGQHTNYASGDEEEPDPHRYEGPMQHVVHVKLHIENPKVYDSEHDMDREVYKHEHSRGNTINKHFPAPDEDADHYEHDDFDVARSRLGHENVYDEHPFMPGISDGTRYPKETRWLNVHPDKAGIAKRYKKRLQDEGHDGVVYGNEYEGTNEKSAIAFEPHQVETTQHHYGPVCLTPKQVREQRQVPGQGHLEGMEDMSHRRRPVDPKFVDPYQNWTKTNHPGWKPGPHPEPVKDQRPLFPPLAKKAAQQPYGEQSALNEMGKQDVYAVRSGDTMVNLCAHHRDVHVGNSRAADALGDQLGLSDRERSAELLGGARKGSCAACGKDTTYQLKLLTPPSMRSGKDERQPTRRRQPYLPTRTKPMEPLRQSENIRWAFKGDLFHADHGKVRYKDDGREGDHDVPVGAELHDNENEAWNKAIEHWHKGRSPFPRVYVVHKPQTEHSEGRTVLSHPAEASELEYDHERHPALRSEHEDDREPILFHGTTRHDDDDPEEITPSGGNASFGPGVADPSYAYATPSLNDAWTYAEKRSENGRGGRPTVYRVTPHHPGDVEKDPGFSGEYSRGNYAHDKRSKSGFEVLDPVPMSEKQEHHWSQSPFNEEAEDDDGDWGESHYGVKRAASWDEDYEPDECELCGEDKNSEDHGEAHHDWIHGQKWHTDWSEDREVGAHNNGEIQRGMAISLPKDIHNVVHDEDRPLHERSKALAEHVIKSANDEGHLGRFWTDEDDVARSYASSSRIKLGGKDDNGTPVTPVVLHVKFPGYHHIETDPDQLEHHGVYSYHIENNREVPLQHGTPMEAVGVSWAHHKYGTDGARHWDADNADWKRHDFKEPIKAMSKKLPTLRSLAHDATENQEVRHCFTGDTRYLTAEGTKTLAETAGTLQRVLTAHQGIAHSGRWVDATIHEFGVQPVLRVTLRRNKQIKVIRATPEHRWMVRRPDRAVLTRDLRTGHRLAHLRAPVFGGTPDHDAIRMGAVFGDGYIARRGERTYGGITLWGAKRDLAKYFDEIAAGAPGECLTDNGVPGLRYQSGMAGYTKSLPSLSADLGYLRGWLMGYFAMDGSITVSGQMTLSSISLETLEHVRDIASLLGIGTYAPTSKLRQGYGAEPSLIHGMGFSAADFDETFFLRDDQRTAWRLPAQERFGWAVVSVEDHGEIETVYCPRVPETESFVLEDGIHTFQCPFCGGGKIIGRNDGSIECEFCHNYFTVQSQPQFPNFPQTINGVPQSVPGMPGQVEAPQGGGAPGTPPGAPGEAPGGDGGNPFANDSEEVPEDTEDDGGDDEPPPFAKKSSRLFKTVTGARLNEEDYVRHLAISLAPDRDAMIARIRDERGTH